MKSFFIHGNEIFYEDTSDGSEITRTYFKNGDTLIKSSWDTAIEVEMLKNSIDIRNEIHEAVIKELEEELKEKND